MSKIYPWDYHSDLTEERLSIIAQLIVDGRQTAVERHDEDAGDNGWTLGCSAFQFARARILWAADSGKHPWLSLIDRTLQLTFNIGSVPVRIYKGEAEEPTTRTLRQSLGELRQLSLLSYVDSYTPDLKYRFAVETDIDGSVAAVKFVGLDGETALLNWEVPYDHSLPAVAGIGRPATETVELPAPTVGVRGAVAEDQDENAG